MHTSRFLLSVTLLAAAACAEAPDHGAAALAATGDPTARVTVLHAGGTPQALTSDGSHLYWVDDADHTLYRMAETGGARTALATGVRVGSPWAVAVDAAAVYWLDLDAGAVRRVGRLGGPVTTLATVASGDEGVAIAVHGDQLFWTERTAGGSRLRRMRKTGGLPVTLATGSALSQLHVDPWFVYVADAYALGGANQIVRVARAGGVKLVLAADEDALGLAGDGGQLFWKRFWTGDVRRGRTWMPGATTISDGGGGWGDLAVDATHVWWTTGPIVHRVARTGGAHEVVAELPSWSLSVAVDDGALYAAVDPSEVEGVVTPGAIVRVTP